LSIRKKEAEKADAQRTGLCAVLAFLFVNLEPQPIRNTDDEDKYKSPIEKRLLEQKMIANKKMRIYSSASIAANPMLPAGFLFESI
jgi:hypothetical protein